MIVLAFILFVVAVGLLVDEIRIQRLTKRLAVLENLVGGAYGAGIKDGEIRARKRAQRQAMVKDKARNPERGERYEDWRA